DSANGDGGRRHTGDGRLSHPSRVEPGREGPEIAMTWVLGGFVLALALFTLLLSGLWVAFALGAVGLIGLLLAGIHWTDLTTIGSIAWNNVNSFTLLPLPLFILMGELMLKTNFSKRFYRGMSLLL